MNTDKLKKIKVLENGPYEVSGNIPLSKVKFISNDVGASLKYAEVEKYPLQETYHLCRCGRSKNKPFCDGSHLEGFSGKETASKQTYEQMADFIKGKHIDLLDAEKLCAVARFCDTHNSTWNLIEEGDSDKTDEIVIQQCCDCPSGRLTAVTKDGRKIEPDLPQEISVLEDPAACVHGPIWIKGGIPIEDAQGRPYPVRNRVTLCRCGKSQNKPFCDARHTKNWGDIDE